MTKLIEFLRNLQNERFYGSVQIDFHAGDITIIRKEQTLKLENMRNNPNELRSK